jgi:hypothetical protein
VVVADFLFTATALVAQPITGIALARQDLSGVENVEEADGQAEAEFPRAT